MSSLVGKQIKALAQNGILDFNDEEF